MNEEIIQSLQVVGRELLKQADRLDAISLEATLQSADGTVRVRVDDDRQVTLFAHDEPLNITPLVVGR